MSQKRQDGRPGLCQLGGCAKPRASHTDASSKALPAFLTLMPITQPDVLKASRLQGTGLAQWAPIHRLSSCRHAHSTRVGNCMPDTIYAGRTRGMRMCTEAASGMHRECHQAKPGWRQLTCR